MSSVEIRKSWKLRGWTFTFTKRPKTARLGRFGGGWQWELGFQAGSGFKTVIINMLICSLRIERPS